MKKEAREMYVVACDCARFKGTGGLFGRVAVPAFKENIEKEEAYLKKFYECKGNIVVTKLIRKGEKGYKSE